jgi:hypothetical protein
MKAKLIKVDDIYTLMDGDKMIASSDSDFQTDYEVMKLSKENCNEIFGVVDVEKLACDECHIDIEAYKIIQTLKSGHSKSELQLESKVDGFILGFNKAVALNKNKLFTEEQMWNMFYFGDSLKRKIKSGKIDNKPMGETFNDYIQSLQQPTEIEVRIVMGCSLPNGCTEPEVECTCEPTYNLDENGCLTLWVLNI